MAAQRLSERWLLGLFLLGLSGGCGAEEIKVTELVLVADSDLPAARFQSLEFLVFDRDGKNPKSYPAQQGGKVVLPAKLGLLHSGGQLGPVTVTANGRLDNGDVATRTHVVSFVKNQTRAVPMHLVQHCFGAGNLTTYEPTKDPCKDAAGEFACVGDVCDTECTETVCKPQELADLPTYPLPRVGAENETDGGLLDGNMPPAPDAGQRDASVEPSDGGKEDAGDVDPPRDGGPEKDAGPVLTMCGDQAVDLQTDPQHCGSCILDCTNTAGNRHFSGTCVAGKCVCETGFADCTPNNLNPACNVQLGSKQNCAFCGDKCVAGNNCQDTSGDKVFMCQ